MRADEMVKQLQDQANLYNSTELNVFAEQVEKLENNNKKLQNELDTACKIWLKYFNLVNLILLKFVFMISVLF